MYEYIYYVDVNECDSNVCLVYFVCGNIVGSYMCVCDLGYKMLNGVC